MARLSYVLIECAQPESNRHTLHGKQEGCHYIMGAEQCEPNCQRSQSTGPDSNPRRRCTRAESSPLDECRVAAVAVLCCSGTRGTRTLTPPVKSQGCCR